MVSDLVTSIWKCKTALQKVYSTQLLVFRSWLWKFYILSKRKMLSWWGPFIKLYKIFLVVYFYILSLFVKSHIDLHEDCITNVQGSTDSYEERGNIFILRGLIKCCLIWVYITDVNWHNRFIQNIEITIRIAYLCLKSPRRTLFKILWYFL